MVKTQRNTETTKEKRRVRKEIASLQRASDPEASTCLKYTKNETLILITASSLCEEKQMHR